MKPSISTLTLIGTLLIACHTPHGLSQALTGAKTATQNKRSDTLRWVKSDSTTYDLIVLDTGYETYLRSVAPPMEYHTKAFYRAQNLRLVNEWNLRYRNPQRYDPSFYSTYIDYQPDVDYGLQLNYKLYAYFQFIRYRYSIRL